MSKIKVSIIGGAGYGAAELLRHLLVRDAVEIHHISSKDYIGQSVSQVHRTLVGYDNLLLEHKFNTGAGNVKSKIKFKEDCRNDRTSEKSDRGAFSQEQFGAVVRRFEKNCQGFQHENRRNSK